MAYSRCSCHPAVVSCMQIFTVLGFVMPLIVQCLWPRFYAKFYEGHVSAWRRDKWVNLAVSMVHSLVTSITVVIAILDSWREYIGSPDWIKVCGCCWVGVCGLCCGCLLDFHLTRSPFTRPGRSLLWQYQMVTVFMTHGTCFALEWLAKRRSSWCTMACCWLASTLLCSMYVCLLKLSRTHL